MLVCVSCDHVNVDIAMACESCDQLLEKAVFQAPLWRPREEQYQEARAHQTCVVCDATRPSWFTRVRASPRLWTDDVELRMDPEDGGTNVTITTNLRFNRLPLRLVHRLVRPVGELCPTLLAGPPSSW